MQGLKSKAISYIVLPIFCVVTGIDLRGNLAAEAQAPYADSHSKAKKRRPQCRDRRDNDRDGLKDYPADPGCRNKRDNREYNRAAPGNNGGDHSSIQLGAGESLHGFRPFPNDNPWNTDISAEEVDPQSDTLLGSIGLERGMHPDFGTVWEGAPIGIPYVVVSGSQAKSVVQFDYAEESDAGPYPIPANPPIEGGPSSEGDRHIIMLDRDNWKLYELFYAKKVGAKWSAGSGAIFDLNSNALRPAGWTSADAAGLPIFPGLVRYDEVVSNGQIQHALRFTAQHTRRAYVSPARHFASSNSDPSLPPLGMRVRLKASVDIAGYPAAVQVILRALKTYGMILADNGSNWYISGAPDSRWNDDDLATLRKIKGSDFEVIKMGEVVSK